MQLQPGVLKQIRETVEKEDGSDQKYNELMKKLFSGLLNLEETILELQQYYKKSIAEEKGAQLFNKFKIDKRSKLELFINYLELKKVSDKAIEKIKQFALEGNRSKLKEHLVGILGDDQGDHWQKIIKSQIKKKKDVLKDSRPLKPQNGLKIYQCPPIKKEQKKQTKNLIVFGETGSGKTTLINALSNYISGVDSGDDFRYKLIVEKNEVTKSQTFEVNDYYVKSQKENTVYRLIDTPGFGDTKGFAADEQTIEQIKLKIKSLSSLHLIIFVLKASQTRISDYQRYVMQSVFNLFPKDCVPNIIFLLTFSDGGKPLVIEAIEDEIEGFGKYIHQIKQPRFVKINNSCIFQPIDSEIKEKHWENAFDAMGTLLSKLNTIKSIELKKSQEYFQLHEKFATALQDYHSKMELIDKCSENICTHLDQTIKIQIQLKRNEKYGESIKVQYRQIPTARPVLRCINCKEINCHLQCTQPSIGKHPDDPSTCNKIDLGGNCLICKCHHAVHKKKKYEVIKFETKEYKVNQEMKQRYLQLKSQFNPKSQDYEFFISRYKSALKEVRIKLKELSKTKEQIQNKGIIQYNFYIKTKMKYIDMIKKTQKQKISLDRLTNELIYLQESLKIQELPKQKLNNFAQFLKKKEMQYAEGIETYQLYQQILGHIRYGISLFQSNFRSSNPSTSLIRSPSKKEEPEGSQSSKSIIDERNDENPQKSNKKRQKQEGSCCLSCFKCIFCCCFG